MGKIDTLFVKPYQLRKNLKIIKPPAGIFMMTTESTCPVGWTEDTDFVDKYPLGANADLGTTGGTETYAHTHVGGWNDLYYGTTGVAVAVQTSSNTSPTWYPPFFKVKFCVRD